ncbi:hypothetical protein NYO91_11415 [Arhodomonas aquaeolei]|nr:MULTISPECIES: hypothetical protein [Arhodomonas]MCS4504685.1 hypothetical protein [Arhodomonas aquaeolei]
MVARDDGDRRPAAFAGLRYELGVVMIFGVVAALLIVGLDLGRWVELVLLAVVGFGAGGWIAVRVRLAEQRALADEQAETGDGTHQE